MAAYKTHLPHDGIHWNIREVLPYQRGFNFINSTRSIGKTYTALGYFIDRFLLTGAEQCAYFVRTSKEKDGGAIKKAFEKVIVEKFSDYEFMFTKENGFVRINEDNPWQMFAWCLAISDHQKIKPNSYPQIHWGLLDEYMIEEAVNKKNYFDGWNEPTHILSMYHTIDRDEDRLKMFFMGNTTQFYNPYHIHPAFKIPYIEPGNIWTSENVLFQRAKRSEKLKDIQEKSKFGRMIKGTSYGNYATEGEYFLDNYSFIGPKPKKAEYYATVVWCGINYAFWISMAEGILFVDKKAIKHADRQIALTLEDHKDNTRYVRAKNDFVLQTIRRFISLGMVRYCDMETKSRVEEFLPKIM